MYLRVSLLGGELWCLVLNVTLPHFRIISASNEQLSWLPYWCGKTHTKYEKHFLLTTQTNKDIEEGKLCSFCSHDLSNIFRLLLWSEASGILGNFHSRGLVTTRSSEAHSLMNWATTGISAFLVQGTAIIISTILYKQV